MHFAAETGVTQFFCYIVSERNNNARFKHIKFRLHRIIIVVRLRRQIFRQIVQWGRRKADALLGRIVQDDEKDASKRAAKAEAVNCAVLP